MKGVELPVPDHTVVDTIDVETVPGVGLGLGVPQLLGVRDGEVHPDSYRSILN